jgi:hypothetical protein
MPMNRHIEAGPHLQLFPPRVHVLLIFTPLQPTRHRTSNNQPAIDWIETYTTAIENHLQQPTTIMKMYIPVYLDRLATSAFHHIFSPQKRQFPRSTAARIFKPQSQPRPTESNHLLTTASTIPRNAQITVP